MSLLFFLCIFLVFLNYCTSFKAPDYFPGDCSEQPDDYRFRPIVFQPNKGVLFTCAENDNVRIKPGGPDRLTFGHIKVQNYECRWYLDGYHFVNPDREFPAKSLLCVHTCQQPPRDEIAHVFAEPENCKDLRLAGQVAPHAYYYCNLKCIEPFMPKGKSPSSLVVYCESILGRIGWQINDGSDLGKSVQCELKCLFYGAYNEDIIGMKIYARTLGSYEGEYYYDSVFAMCGESYEAVSLVEGSVVSEQSSCLATGIYSTLHFYCEKRCRKPGGAHGQPGVPHHIFACSGRSGWYKKCNVFCEAGYDLVVFGRAPADNLYEARCIDGFWWTPGEEFSVCKKECSPLNRCPQHFFCTGFTLDSRGVDTGKRHCVKRTGASGMAIYEEVVQSFVTMMAMKAFGRYDWLQ